MPRVNLVILRGSDVATYVRHGAADLGVAGKDMLLESGGAGVALFDYDVDRIPPWQPRDRNDVPMYLVGGKRYYRPGAMAIHALMLGAERLGKCLEISRIDRTIGRVDDKIETLPLVVQCRRPADLHLIGR